VGVYTACLCLSSMDKQAHYRAGEVQGWALGRSDFEFFVLCVGVSISLRGSKLVGHASHKYIIQCPLVGFGVDDMASTQLYL
jgi:hypothetical protein